MMVSVSISVYIACCLIRFVFGLNYMHVGSECYAFIIVSVKVVSRDLAKKHSACIRK